MNVKKILLILPLVILFAGCSSTKHKKTAKRKHKSYNMYLNDHPKRDKKVLKEMNKHQPL